MEGTKGFEKQYTYDYWAVKEVAIREGVAALA